MRKKNILITGANRGIGQKTAKLLLNNNYNIIGTSTTQSGVNIINEYLKIRGKGFKLNLKKKSDIKNTIKKIHKEIGCIDILINNAGITADSLFQKMHFKNWENVIKINLHAIFYLLKYITPCMIKNKYGRIITIASIIGNIGNIGQVNYSASKSALIGFNKSIALEMAKYGINSNIVSPGYIKTDMTKKINKKQKKKILSNIPMRRFGKKKEIASVIKFLISDSAAYITGQNLHINGGLLMK
ncbi:3-oxoacyl-ACP reductase FabG [Buchnera aphidicola (Mollitrichosiphum nigrofasciatum)]|uniref:3-oxoacyl-ACP reductase FabG n=1 Tax=Buchnera aphidicola TaxID=9 RepID=UPI0031B8267B